MGAAVHRPEFYSTCVNDGDLCIENGFEFYRLPFPGDIRLVNGKISLAGHPSPGEVLGIDVAGSYLTAATDLTGNTTVYNYATGSNITGWGLLANELRPEGNIPYEHRYWSFDRQDLVSAWLALGSETKSNGCLKVIPGTHQMDIEEGRFDAKKFLRPDLPINHQLIDQAIDIELEAGDLLFFHSRLFHAAGRNQSDRVKMSLVFTYHSADNAPIMDTRSARYPSITLGSNL